MIKLCYLTCLLALMVLLLSTPVGAQDNEPAPPPATDAVETPAEEPEVPASQEVEINEDNYRQFMELRDANRQRNIIPENVFKPNSGLQKLEKLPEESQKHLRNQLREIIVQGDEWKPGDEETEYPYTPSEAASTDPSLEQQEKEAWGELVDSYHQRESQIYENSSGSRSAMGTENGTSSKPGEGAGSTSGTGQSGEGSEAQQAGQEGNADQGADTGSYSPNAPRDPNAKSTAGVSQNAMEFLQGLGKGGSGAGQGDQGDSTEGGGPGGESPTPSEAQSQAQTGQQASSEQSNAVDGSTSTSARDPNARSTAGASQNAMEFLKGSAGQGENASQDGTGTAEGNEGQSEAQGGESGSAQADGQQTEQSEGQDAGETSGQTEGQDDGQPGGEDSGEKDGQADGQTDGQGDEKTDGQNEGQSQDGQQTESEQKPATSVPADTTSPVSSTEPAEESTAGASQNALEYLTGEGIQSSDDMNNEPVTSQPEGTLTIQDLLNARGVGDTVGTIPESTGPDAQQPSDETKPDKDGGG